PTFEVKNASPGRRDETLQNLTLVTQAVIEGKFDGSPFTVRRNGDTVTMDLTMRADAGGFDRLTRMYDIHTAWAPLNVRVTVDPLVDHKIVKSGVPFPRRRYSIS